MRKIILRLLVSIAVLLAFFLVIGTVRKVKKHEHMAKKIASLPAFSLMTLSNGIFNLSEIKEGPVLIVHFHPECEHCKYEIFEIMKSDIPILFTKVILISSAHPDSIRKFLKDFNYTDFQSVITLFDSYYEFEGIFGNGFVPSNYIYNKELKLVKVLHGEVKTEVLIQCLQDSE